MKTNTNILKHSAILIFFLLFFAIVYWPVTQGRYLYGEDYTRIWTSGWTEANEQSYVLYTRKLPVEGRPLHTLYFYIIFNKYINAVKSIEAANTVRIAGIIGIGLLAFVLYRIFRENRFRTDHAFLLSIMVCALPPFQNYLGRLICVAFIYSVLLSALSALVLFKAVFKENGVKTANLITAIPISIVLFIAALCIYQPTATIYWAMAVIPLVMISDEDFVKKWRLPFAIYFSTGFASMVIYYGIIKIYNSLLGIELQARGAFVYNSLEVFNKIIWFINYPLYTASNLWNIILTKEVAIIVSIVIITGILSGVGRAVWQLTVEKKKPDLLLNSLCRYFLVLILLPLSYISSLITKGLGGMQLLIPHHRTVIGPEIIILLLFYWGLMNTAEFSKTIFNYSADLKKNIITVVLIILTVVAAFLANHNVDKYFTKHHTDEYEYVKNTIQEFGISNVSKLSKIYVIWPSEKVWEDISVIYGEFYNVGLPGNIVRLVLAELGINSAPISFIRIEDSDNQLKKDENVLIVDMTKLSLKGRYGGDH